ncbi:hypothetical protein FXO38_00926 [Capsicum annuum]|nr:hypothetical protein FXO38_00926 [Capsicum annuum]KAF3685119.1 hypothetical protein FXO37_00945 [Capsicum annuum]
MVLLDGAYGVVFGGSGSGVYGRRCGTGGGISWIKYVGDDKDLEEGGKKKMDEIWINYCGMPVCFGLQEFTIMTGLRCHHPEEPPPRKRSKARKCKEKIDGLFDIALCDYKALDFLTDLEDKAIPEQYREQLFLVWFAHSVILARDINKVIDDNLLVMDYLDEVSHPRMFRWLDAKSNTNIKEADLFNPPDDVAHLLQESMMTSDITLGHVDTIADPMVELIKKKLVGATAIRRVVRQGQPNVEALHDQPTKAYLGASSGGGVDVGGRYVDAATTHDDDHVDAQEKINCWKIPIFTLAQVPLTPLHPRVLVVNAKSARTAKINSLKKQLTYREAYDASDMIMDLDFYKNLKDRYDQFNGEASALEVGLDFLVPTLDLDEDQMIKYIRGERPNPHGKSWTEEKRILAFISMNDMYYRAIEILLEEININVYDCNIPLVDASCLGRVN